MQFRLCVNIIQNSRVLWLRAHLLQTLHYAKFTTNGVLLRKTKYGGEFTVTMIAGDSFGPQIMTHVKDIFKCAKVPVNFEEFDLDLRNRDEMLQELITSIKRNGVGIKGSISAKRDNFHIQSRNVLLRQKLDLFANVLHCKSQPGIKTKHNDVDLILVRQNTEGEYSCLEHNLTSGVVESLKIVTRARSEEISHFAFQYALQRNRRKITAVHKENVMPMSDGLFLDSCKAVGKEYPTVELDTILLDTCCNALVTKPQQFDVLIFPNLYGNVISNIACGLIGGAGIVSGQNFGHDCAVFEVGCRSSVESDNPVPMINASIDLLYYLGLETFADVLKDSVHKTLNVNRFLTPDLGGTSNASDVVHHIKKTILEKT